MSGQTPQCAPYPHTPLGAFEYNEDFFILTPEEESGGIPPTIRSNREAIKKLNLNEQFFLKLYQGTPFILFKNQTGQPDYISGVPEDINQFINNLYIR